MPQSDSDLGACGRTGSRARGKRRESQGCWGLETKKREKKKKKKKGDRQDWQGPEVVLLPGSTVCLVARQHRLSQKREGRSE